MPRDSNGNYSLPSGNPVIAGTPIATTWGNPTMNDIATELTGSLSRNGQGGMLVAMKFADGTFSAPGITFTSEPNSGIFRQASNDIEMSIAGIPRMRWTATGIDVWDPIGSVWFALVNADGPNWILADSGFVSGPFEFQSTLHVVGAADFDSTLNVDGAVQFNSTLIVAGAMGTNGYLGVMTVPTEQIHVLGEGNATGVYDDGLLVTSNNATVKTQYNWNGLATKTAHGISFGINNVPKMHLGANGNLAIGGPKTAYGSSPDAGLEICVNAGGAVANDINVHRSGAGGTAIASNSWIQLFNDTDNKGHGIQLAQDGGLGFWTFSSGWVEGIRFEAGGGMNVRNGKTIGIWNTGNTVVNGLYLNATDKLGLYPYGGVIHNKSSTNIGGAVTMDTAAASGAGNEGDIWLQYT